MAFYDDMADVATELLTEFGKTMNFQRATDTFDPVTGRNTLRTTETFSPVGVEVPINNALIDGTRVMVGDRFIVIDTATGYVPDMGDMLDLWSIVALEPINPAGTPVAYRLQVRK